MTNEQDAALPAGRSTTAPASAIILGLEKAIDGRRVGSVQYRVFLLCFLLSFLDGFDLQTMGLAAPLLAREWQVAPSLFAPALAAAIAGLGLGSTIFGMLGDRYGRRPFLIAAGLIVAVGTLGTMTAGNVHILILWRLVTGMGFGAVMPNSLALVADFMPARCRIFAMTVLTSAMSAGAMAAGFAGPMLVTTGSWRTLFLVGGIMPLLLAPVLFLLLDESPKFLAGKYGDVKKLEALMVRMGAQWHWPDTHAMVAPAIAVVGRVRARRAYLLPFIFYVMTWMGNAFIFYLLVSWMPTFLLRAGVAQADAMRSIAYINGGGFISGLLLSLLMDRAKHRFAIVPAIGYAVALIIFLCFGLVVSAHILAPLCLVIGLVVAGSQFLLPAIASHIYPSDVLATAIGWATALSRLGAVLGPLAGGMFIAHDLSLDQSMELLALPALLCLVSISLLHVVVAKAASKQVRSVEKVQAAGL